MLAHQWLATGNADPANTQRRKCTNDAFYFIKRQPFIRLREVTVVFRQALEATQVTAIRHGKTDIFNCAVERID